MRYALAAAGCLLALSACSNVPNASHFPSQSQQIVASAAHWKIIADNAAAKLVPSLTKDAYLAPLGPDAAPAGEAIRTLLATSLTDRGISLTAKPGPGTDVVHLDIKFIGHDRPSVPHTGTATVLGTIGGMIVWAATTDATVSAAAAPAIGLGVGAAIEALKAAFPASPNTEIILTAGVIRNGRETARSSAVYYVSPADADLYQGAFRPILLPIK